MMGFIAAVVPTDVTARSLAPDLARGVMLLAIALAHAPAFVSNWDLGLDGLNTVAKFARSLLVDNQARTMFVFLFGYGLGQLAERHYAKGNDWPSLRKFLRRRSVWLIAIGFVHEVFLVPLDIIAVYGLALLILAPLVRASDSVLCWTSALTLIPATALLSWQSMTAQAAASIGSPVTMAQFMQSNYGAHIIAFIPSWPIETAVSVLIVVPAMLMGIWAARRRILDEPERHVSLLYRATLILLGVSLVGRLPAALLAAGAWTDISASMAWTVAIAHTLTGYVGGIGLAAVIGLVAIRIGNSHGRLTTALAALGQRSLTFYLFQSVAWLVLFYPFTLALHDDMGFAATLEVAVGIWIVSVLLAEWMRLAGYRGPLEVLLRRLSYSRSTSDYVSDVRQGNRSQ